MEIIVQSLEEVLIDGKLSGTVLDVVTPSNKSTLWDALCIWRDVFLTGKAEEIQQIVLAKESVEAELATATSQVAEHGSLIHEIAKASSLDEVKALLPVSEEDLKAQRVAELEAELSSLKAPFQEESTSTEEPETSRTEEP